MDNWINSEDDRKIILESIPSHEETVYWTSSKCEELFEEYEALMGVRLGLRREVNAFELVIALPDGSAASYNNWSDGQNSIFFIYSALEKELDFLFAE